MLKKILGDKKLIADIILIASVLLVGLSVFLIVNLTKEVGNYVRVSVDGRVVGEYSLSVDGEYSLNGGTNVLVIKDGKAYFSYSNCPDKTCVNGNSIHGQKISFIGQRIDCLPNRVMVEVIGEGEEIIGGR